MSLIRQINEASSQSLADLKKTIQKDPRVAGILKSAFTIDDINNKKEFLETLKFLLLNNPNVKAFVDARHNVKDLFVNDLKYFRKTKVEDMDARWLSNAATFIKNLFKEQTAATNGSLSRDARKAIDEWVNSNGWRNNISPTVQRELLSLDVRPTKPVVLYRGLLFSKSSLIKREKYDGSIEKGNGLAFLESIRSGKAEADVTWDKASSWTTSKKIANNFAMFGPSSSEFGAMSQWLGRMADKKFIDGELGFVISTLAKPEDILVDVNMLNTSGQHGNEGEVILKAGTYHSKIIKKYTVEGEADPVSKKVDASSDKTLTSFKAFTDAVSEIEVPESFKVIKDFPGYGTKRFLTKPESFKKLIANTATADITTALEHVLKAYNEHIHPLSKDDTSKDKYVGNDDHIDLIDKLESIKDTLGHKIKHPSLESGRGTFNQLDAKDARNTIDDTILSKVERSLKIRGSISDKYTANDFMDLGAALGVPAPGRLHVLGSAKQTAYIDAVLTAFFKMLGTEKPSDTNEAVSKMVSYLRRADRNYKLIEKMTDVRNYLKLK